VRAGPRFDVIEAAVMVQEEHWRSQWHPAEQRDGSLSVLRWLQFAL